MSQIMNGITQATIGIRKIIAYYGFLFSVTWLTYYDKPIPDALVWGTGLFFGVNLTEWLVKNRNGNSNVTNVTNNGTK